MGSKNNFIEKENFRLLKEAYEKAKAISGYNVKSYQFRTQFVRELYKFLMFQDGWSIGSFEYCPEEEDVDFSENSIALTSMETSVPFHEPLFSDNHKGSYLDYAITKIYPSAFSEHVHPNFEDFLNTLNREIVYGGNLCKKLKGCKKEDISAVDTPLEFVNNGLKAYESYIMNLGPDNSKTYAEHISKSYDFYKRAKEELESMIN